VLHTDEIVGNNLDLTGKIQLGGADAQAEVESKTDHVRKQYFPDAIRKGLPADSIEFEEQTAVIKEVFETAKVAVENALRIDKGVTKENYFVFVQEDKKRYLTVPSNIEDLIMKPGWDALFALMKNLGILMKKSNAEYLNAGSSEETRLFLAGLTNRICKDDWNPEVDTFIVSGSRAAERGRAMADLYTLKKTSSIMNLEKFLPASSKIGETSYIRYYLNLIAGSNRAESLKAIPDILNKVLSNWVDVNEAIFKEISAKTKLSIGQATQDLTRKSTKKVKKDGKIVEVHTPIHAARVSGSPFTITTEERDHFKSQERHWDDLEEFNKRYAKGIPIDELEKARERYKNSYNGQMQYAQATGSFKSRRMEAFKRLAEVSMNSREMKDFKLTKKTREIALENMVKIIQSYNAETNAVDAELDKILINMRPVAEMDRVDLWAIINTEMLLKLYGFKQPSRTVKRLLDKHGETIHRELVSYFPTMITLTPMFGTSEDTCVEEQIDEPLEEF